MKGPHQLVYIIFTSLIALIGIVLPAMSGFTEGNKAFFRMVYFGASSVFGFVVYTNWIVFVSPEEREIVSDRLIASMGCFMIAFMVYFTNFPERCWPRVFDFIG